MITAEELATELEQIDPYNNKTKIGIAIALLPFIQSRAAGGQGVADGSLRKALTMFMDAKTWIASDSWDGIDKNGRDLMEQADVAARTALATPQLPKDSGAVPMPERYSFRTNPPLPGRAIPAADGQWCKVADAIRYGEARAAQAYLDASARIRIGDTKIAELEAREAAAITARTDYTDGYAAGMKAKIDQAEGRADAVPVCTCPSGDGSLSHPCQQHPPAEIAARAQVAVSEPRIDAIYNWCATRGLFGDVADEVTDDDIVAALDDYEGALIEAAEVVAIELPKNVRLYSKKELKACEDSASTVARTKAFDEVREMCAPLGYESFREAFDALGKLQEPPAHAGAGDADTEYGRIYAEVIKVCGDQPMAHEIARRLAGGDHA